MDTGRYIFWLNDPKVLYENNRYLEIIPTKEMTKVEQMNAITRFMMYYILLLFLFNKQEKIIVMAIFIIIFIIFLHSSYKSDEKGKIKEYELRERFKSPYTYNYDELLEYNKNTCKKPKVNNPFMNPSAVEPRTTPVACNADDSDIKEDIIKSFNENLFRDIDAVWEIENSQRQFYTLPNTTIPNKQHEFAKWCYDTGKTCKEDQFKCYRYEDLRTNKF